MRILVLLIISFFSFSQEEQYRSEFAWCNLKDENSIDDAKNIASKYGEFVESVGSQYEQSFLAPMHAGDSPRRTDRRPHTVRLTLGSSSRTIRWLLPDTICFSNS